MRVLVLQSHKAHVTDNKVLLLYICTVVVGSRQIHNLTISFCSLGLSLLTWFEVSNCSRNKLMCQTRTSVEWIRVPLFKVIRRKRRHHSEKFFDGFCSGPRNKYQYQWSETLTPKQFPWKWRRRTGRKIDHINCQVSIYEMFTSKFVHFLLTAQNHIIE